MKVKISYFYNIRFFKPYQIPVSTACYDPRWYYSKGVVKDKNGVYNGIRMELLHADAESANCSLDCKDDPATCTFLTVYRDQLRKTNFQEVYNWLQQLADNVQNLEGFEEEPEVVLMVYEAPDNKCSERGPLIDWFKENGYDLEELKVEK